MQCIQESGDRAGQVMLMRVHAKMQCGSRWRQRKQEACRACGISGAAHSALHTGIQGGNEVLAASTSHQSTAQDTSLMIGRNTRRKDHQGMWVEGLVMRVVGIFEIWGRKIRVNMTGSEQG